MNKSVIAVIVSVVVGLMLQSLTLVTFLGFSDALGGQVENGYIYFIPGLLFFVIAPLISWFISKNWKAVVLVILVLVVTYVVIWFGFTTSSKPIKQTSI